MDRIEELLRELGKVERQIGANDYATGTVSAASAATRDALRQQIIDEWQAKDAALEAAQRAITEIGGLATVNEGDVITMLPYHARKLAALLNEARPIVDTALARARGTTETP